MDIEAMVTNAQELETLPEECFIHLTTNRSFDIETFSEGPKYDQFKIPIKKELLDHGLWTPMTTESIIMNSTNSNDAKLFSLGYSCEAISLADAVENANHSKVKIYCHLYELIKFSNKNPGMINIESEWNKTRQLKDIYFIRGMFKVKIYIGVKNGITFRFITNNHRIIVNPFDFSLKLKQGKLDLDKFTSNLAIINKRGDDRYNKYKKIYGIK